MAHSHPDIAIIGGGPSGLLLAALLERHQIPYIIYERDEISNPDIRGSSGTLDIHTGTGQLALEEAGLLDEFNRLARYDASTAIAKHTGQVLLSIAQDGSVGGESRPEIDRRDLRKLLLSAIPAERIRWEKKVQDLERSADGRTTVYFTDGTIEKDIRLVVGADGAWSKVRSLVTASKPEYSGMTFLTTNIAADSQANGLAAGLAGRGNYIALGGGNQISTQLLADGSYYTCFGIKGLPESWAKDNKDLIGDRAALRKHLLQEHFSDWASPLQDLARDREGGFYIWPLYYMPTAYLDENSVKGVALMGDAAHVTPPSGEGVNWALFDALQLARQIIKSRTDGNGIDIERAVREYEAEAKPRWRGIIDSARSMVDSLYTEGAPETFLTAENFMPDDS